MKNKHTWNFKKYFRKGAFGWKGTALAAKRLKEAVSEIRKTAKSDPILAAEGSIILMERLYPALEHIDSSSGALGNAVNHTLNELIPFLINAPADKAIRKKWLDQLYTAITNDGVQYLSPVEEYWGQICAFPELINEWAGRLLPGLKECWQSRKIFSYFHGSSICLSCLLDAERYDELKYLLSLKGHKFWSYDQFYAEALKRQGRIAEAIDYAESCQKGSRREVPIMEFCESLLIQSGLREEAYNRYGLFIREGQTYLSQFKSIIKKYPEYSEKKILINLINHTDNKAAWFSSARQAGFLDIALDCAQAGYVDIKTLNRASRDTLKTDVEFSHAVSFRAIELLIEGYGYEITNWDVEETLSLFMQTAKILKKAPEALETVKNLANNQPKMDSFLKKILNGFFARTT